MNTGYCKRCRFSRRQKNQDGSLGLSCRYDPPRVVTLPVQSPQGVVMQITAAWPPTDEDGWCGKFEQDPVLNS